MEKKIVCPECGSDSIYRYGKTIRNQQKYLCLNCDRQFTASSTYDPPKNRPPCPICGRPMHVYMRRASYIRYRCSDYPDCKGYQKVDKPEFKGRTMEKICKYCRYWNIEFSSEPGVFGCCLSPENHYGVPEKMRTRNFELFETVRFYTCEHWAPCDCDPLHKTEVSHIHA